MRSSHDRFNPKQLDSKPYPKSDWSVVFDRECELGDPRLVPDKMLCQTKSEFQLLGRMYDLQYVSKLDYGPTPSFLGTQQSYLNMLRNRGLVYLITNQRNRYRLTDLGVRVYELNYWLDDYKRRKSVDRMLQNAKERALSDARQGWVNPKPDSEPDAIPPRRLNLTPMEVDLNEKPSDDGPALPPGVYPAL